MKDLLFRWDEGEPTGGESPVQADPAVQAAPEAAPEAVPAEPQAAPQKAWYETLKEHGLPSGKDEAETLASLKRLSDERSALEAVRPYIPHVNDYIKNASDYAKWKAEQAKAAPQVKEKPWWSDMWAAPEYDPSWERYIIIGEDGQRRWSNDAPMDVQQKYTAYQHFTAEKAKEFMRNPYEFIGPAIEKRARAIAEEVVRSQFQESRVSQSNEQFVNQNEWWLFEIDEASKRRKTTMAIDPSTGKQVETPVLSPHGRQYVEYIKQIQQRQAGRGYQDDEEARELALVMVQKDAAMSQLAELAPPPDPASAQQKKKQEFLDKANPAGKAAGRAGNMKAAEEEVNGRNLEQIFRRELEMAGA
jgi:hypothetical protein